MNEIVFLGLFSLVTLHSILFAVVLHHWVTKVVTLKIGAKHFKWKMFGFGVFRFKALLQETLWILLEKYMQV